MFTMHIDTPTNFEMLTKQEFFDQVWTRTKALAMEAYRRCVAKTPVDTGRAKNNWQISLNELIGSSMTGSNPMTAQFAKLKEVVPGTVPSAIYISNNVMYMDVLEFGMYPGNGPKTTNGFSTQAPQGIIAPTVKELAAYLEM